jgi:hypothetical protein
MHAVSLADDFTSLRVTFDFASNVCLPGVSRAAVDRLVGALAPHRLESLGSMRRLVRRSLSVMREPLQLASMVCSGGTPLETKLYWSVCACDEVIGDDGYLSSAWLSMERAAAAMGEVAEALRVEGVDGGLLEAMYGGGGRLDGMGVDMSNGGSSGMKVYYTPMDGRDVGLFRAGLRWAGIRGGDRLADGVEAAMAREPMIWSELVGAERVGGNSEVKAYFFLAGMAEADRVKRAVSLLCSGLGRRDASGCVSGLVDKLSVHGGRLGMLGFDVGVDGGVEVKPYVWPRTNYAGCPRG